MKDPQRTQVGWVLSFALLTSALVRADGCSLSCDNTYQSLSHTPNSSCHGCHTVFLPRSTNSNTAYKWLPFAHNYESKDSWNGGGDIGFEYQQSFKSDDIAKCMFGSSSLHFQGSRVTDRSETALIAENFGLSQLFDGTIHFAPRIQNFNFHLQTYLGLDCWLEGLYTAANLTFTHQKRTLFDITCDHLCSQTVALANTTAFPAGYMSVGAAQPASSIEQALSGHFLFGDMQTPWKFGKFVTCEQKLNEVAGVDLILGYNFWRNDCSHFGAFFIYTAPTGNKIHAKSAEYVFSPIIGNGHHHEVGGGISAHYELWNNNCDQSINAYLDGHVTSMLKNCQVRSFDFKDRGCMSRYMLLKEMTATTHALGEYVFTGTLINGINFATRYTDVKVPVKGDATLRFVYQKGNWDFGLGYNIYGQEKEKVCVKSGSPCDAISSSAYYAFKGCSGDYGFGYSSITNGHAVINGQLDPFAQKLNTTENNATITSCASADNAIADTNDTSIVVDWTNIYDGTGTGRVSADAVPAGVTVTNLVAANLSDPAIVFDLVGSQTLLDLGSGKAPRQLIHKGFITIEYTWKNCCWSPYVGIGGEVEGGTRHCDYKQWGIWLKGGLSF